MAIDPLQAPAGEREDRWWCAHCQVELAEGEARLMRSGRLRCPNCGRRLVDAAPEAVSVASSAGRDLRGTVASEEPGRVALASGPTGAGALEAEEPLRAPWHFKVLVVGTVLYLVYRLIWFVFWLTGHAWHG
jgi:DNA-directed RNA polymerase subunit RPC12/RpoP